MNYGKDIILQGMERIKRKMGENMRDKNRIASGYSIRSLGVAMTANGAELKGASSWLTMERGRRPSNKMPKGIHDAIRQWILDKGIPYSPYPYKTNRPHKYSAQEAGLRALAGAIVHTIMTKGTYLYRNGLFDDIMTSIIREECKVMTDKLAVYYGIEIKKINENMTRKR